MTDQAHVPYEIVHQEARTEPDGNGNFASVMRVHFHTPEGVRDHVDIPDQHYTAEYAHALIMDKAQRIAQVHNLPHSLPARQQPAGA